MGFKAFIYFNLLRKMFDMVQLRESDPQIMESQLFLLWCQDLFSYHFLVALVFTVVKVKKSPNIFEICGFTDDRK